jgi:hypothetical protein
LPGLFFQPLRFAEGVFLWQATLRSHDAGAGKLYSTSRAQEQEITIGKGATIFRRLGFEISVANARRRPEGNFLLDFAQRHGLTFVILGCEFLVAEAFDRDRKQNQ